ncbi:hypothetical protein SBA3_710010 [Candidatus Sulfopaludibacter sp. SbA3]|nr:hypothetical protein SBA3_710010 [Candidatus Sulfopaludibacter sp. SbA3]
MGNQRKDFVGHTLGIAEQPLVDYFTSMDKPGRGLIYDADRAIGPIVRLIPVDDRSSRRGFRIRLSHLAG